MKKLLATFLLLFAFTFLHAQNKAEIDSLLLVIDTLTNELDKAKNFRRLHELTMFTNPELARDYAQKALDISITNEDARGIASGYMQIGNYFINRTENDSASYYLHLALDKFIEANSIRGQIFVIHSLADIERSRGNYDSAIALVNKNISLYENRDTLQSDLGAFNLIGAEYEVLGAIYMDQGNYQLALQETLKAARFFNDTKDKIREADALKQIGNIEYGLGNYQSSLKYCEEAYQIYGDFEDKVYQSYAANSAGLAAEGLKDYALAQKYHEKAIMLAREMNVKSSLSTSLKDLGRIYIVEKNYSEAKKVLEEALQIAREIDVKLDISSALLELATIDMNTNAQVQALEKLNEVIDITEPIGALYSTSIAYKYRSEVFQSLNNSNAALEDFKVHHQFNDSIFNEKKSQQIEELKTIYETEKKEAAIALQEIEIQTLNQEVEINTLRKQRYAGGMFTFIAVSVLLLFGFRQRMKKNRIEREKQEELLKQEIEFKKKELASQTLHLVQKNTFLQELKENLEKIKNSPDLFKMEFRHIVMLLKREKTSDNDWQVFKSYFSEVHDSFDKKLMSIYQDITEKELRMASFIKMKLSTKEIAAMLNVLPDSVLKSKYRLKKKLGLDKETDLYQFLNTL
jgi:tetratricopeptide (TPR) repeat protein